MKAVSLEPNLRTEAAASQLVAARLARRPGARLAESCRPRDNETALAIQRRVGELLHFDVGGWKNQGVRWARNASGLIARAISG